MNIKGDCRSAYSAVLVKSDEGKGVVPVAEEVRDLSDFHIIVHDFGNRVRSVLLINREYNCIFIKLGAAVAHCLGIIALCVGIKIADGSALKRFYFCYFPILYFKIKHSVDSLFCCCFYSACSEIPTADKRCNSLRGCFVIACHGSAVLVIKLCPCRNIILGNCAVRKGNLHHIAVVNSRFLIHRENKAVIFHSC